MANLEQCELAAVYVEAVILASASPSNVRKTAAKNTAQVRCKQIIADALQLSVRPIAWSCCGGFGLARHSVVRKCVARWL